jgi:hypothetical protein
MACEEVALLRDRRVHEAALFVGGRPLPDGFVWCAACRRMLTLAEWVGECDGD